MVGGMFAKNPDPQNAGVGRGVGIKVGSKLGELQHRRRLVYVLAVKHYHLTLPRTWQETLSCLVGGAVVLVAGPLLEPPVPPLVQLRAHP